MNEIHVLDQEQVSAIMGVSTVTVSRCQRDPDDPLPMIAGSKGRGNKAQYDPGDFGKWLKRRWTGQQDGLNLDQERAKNLAADTILKQLKEAQLRNESAPLELLQWALSNLGSQISAILETIPAKLKRQVPSLTYTDLELIRKEIIKTQNAAARVQIELPADAREPEPDCGPGTTNP